MRGQVLWSPNGRRSGKLFISYTAQDTSANLSDMWHPFQVSVVLCIITCLFIICSVCVIVCACVLCMYLTVWMYKCVRVEARARHWTFLPLSNFIFWDPFFLSQKLKLIDLVGLASQPVSFKDLCVSRSPVPHAQLLRWILGSKLKSYELCGRHLTKWMVFPLHLFL